MADFRPRIVAFACNWCSYAGADKAGGKRLAYSADVVLIRMMCTGRIDPQFVMAAFRGGADGVMILGCHPGDCHYRTGNIKALRRFRIFERMLGQFGIERKRFRLDWVAAGEAERFQAMANEMAATIRELGPLSIKGYVETTVAQ